MSATFSPTTAVPAGKVHTWEYLKKIGVPIAMFLGAYQAVIMRKFMSPDGVAYLDMGDRIWNEGWFAAANGYWSPLYPAVLGGVLKLFKPSMYDEFAVVHVVNVAIFVCALLAFNFFWNRAIAFNNCQRRNNEESSRTSWLLLGWSLFAWVSLSLNSTGWVTPDLLASSFIYLAAGILLTINSGDHGLLSYLILGAVLSLAYLAKAAMFPVALMFLAMTLFGPAGVRKNIPRAFAAAVLFLMISSAWIAPLSRVSGHVTFGETAPINYAWEVSGVPKYSHEPPGVRLLHPVTVISRNPSVYQFVGPIRGSYPFWTDPAYWLAGVKPHFTLHGQLRAFIANAGRLAMLPGVLLWGALFLFLVLLVRDRKAVAHNVARFWILLLPSIAAILMYTLVHLEGRYIGPFLAILFTAPLIAASATSSRLLRQVMPALAISAGILLIAWILVDTLVKDVKLGTTSEENFQAAADLKRLGFRAGEPVGSIGDAYYAYWARLARLQIIAEITREDAQRFWAERPEKQAQIIEAFRRTGARAIVADDVPAPNSSNGWRRLSKTKYYIYDFRSLEAIENQ